MVVTIVWLLIILLFSIIPTRGLQTGHPSDKIVHFVIYGIQAVIFFRVLKLKVSLSKTIILSISLASIYGLAMELLQLVLPWRKFSFSDEIANVSGAFCFGIIYALKGNYRRFLKKGSGKNR